MDHVTYTDTGGREVSYEQLEKEWEDITRWYKKLGIEQLVPWELSVAGYIQRSIERGLLQMEVWD